MPLVNSDTDHGASLVPLVATCGIAGGNAKRPASLPQEVAFLSSSSRNNKSMLGCGSGDILALRIPKLPMKQETRADCASSLALRET